jgi:hypothetical protein
MPLPKPEPAEAQYDFIQRCYMDASVKEEFPFEQQRLAVCYTQWRDNK